MRMIKKAAALLASAALCAAMVPAAAFADGDTMVEGGVAESVPAIPDFDPSVDYGEQTTEGTTGVYLGVVAEDSQHNSDEYQLSVTAPTAVYFAVNAATGEFLVPDAGAAAIVNNSVIPVAVKSVRYASAPGSTAHLVDRADFAATEGISNTFWASVTPASGGDPVGFSYDEVALYDTWNMDAGILSVTAGEDGAETREVTPTEIGLAFAGAMRNIDLGLSEGDDYLQLGTLHWTFSSKANSPVPVNEAYAILTDDGTGAGTYAMSFVRSFDDLTKLTIGEEYDVNENGLIEESEKKVVAVYDNVENVNGRHPWYNVRGQISSVVFYEEVAPVGSMMDFFAGFTSCSSFDLAKLNTSNVTSMETMFWVSWADQDLITRFDVSSFDFSNVETMEDMFSGRENVEEIVWPADADFGKLTTAESMFYNNGAHEEALKAAMPAGLLAVYDPSAVTE